MKLKNNPLGFIWDILHDRGHYPQGVTPTDTANPERYEIEKQAWDFAEEEIKNKYPLLEEMIEDFYKHRDNCLKTYM